MLNRTITPELQQIDKIDFVKPQIFDISGETKLFFMQEVPNDTARLDLYFDAGTVNGKTGIASFVNGLLLSGTTMKTSIQINSEIDGLGGFFESGVSNENAVVTMYSLRENLLPILRIMKDAIQNLALHDHEVEEQINDRRQKFRVNMEKVSFLAQRAFQQRLFNDSLYGRVSREEDFDEISIQELRGFFNENYLKGLSKVVVVGDLSQDEIDEVIDLTGSWAKGTKSEFEKNISNLKGSTHIVKEGALQTAIRVGRMLFNKTHSDYNDFLILNTIFGDYFGSRLMSNIREDKGYTYGIGTMVAELHEVGYFLIATEVGKEAKDATLKEIQYEMERLQTELVGRDELELVKNYMLGQLLKSADGPYSMTDLYMSVEPYGLELDFYNEAIESINSITPERIMELAKKYLNWNEMTVVSAG
ncbi:MAG: M16 family metallopeptidase [Flavobacteriia bacterium]|jgi:zinc protease